MDMKKLDLQRLINSEHGIDYHRNINLGGYTFYLGDSFISFEIIDVEGKNIVRIDYIYVTDANALITLLGHAVQLWVGNDVVFLYYQEHLRNSNVDVKLLESLGLKIITNDYYQGWKHNWKSTNGYPESRILEAISGK